MSNPAAPLFHRYDGLDEYRASPLWATRVERILAERALALAHPQGEIHGMCTCCCDPTRFDFSAVADEAQPFPNWREELRCARCGLIMRWRYCFTFLDELLRGRLDARIYITDNASPTFAWLHARYPNAIGSEFVRDEATRARLDTYLAHLTGEPSIQVRHEDVTALTLDAESVDAVLSFEVLEHVPDYPAALREFLRVLRPGGSLLLTVPFLEAGRDTIVRARVLPSGQVEHLLEPEYHGDPTSDDGCLCYYNFGWDLLEMLRETGFREVGFVHSWAPAFGFMSIAGCIVATR